MKEKCIGVISESVCSILKIPFPQNSNIYLGESNINHMITSHPDDYSKYGNHIQDILSHPDYVGMNKKDYSIEYVKLFIEDNDFVKVAVRVSTSGKYYARTLYTLNNNRVQNFINNKTLISVDKYE